MQSVLVLDDLAMVRDVLARELSAAGFDVVCSPTVSDAKARLRGRSFELLLMDLRPCSNDRITLLRELREDPATADLPVIALACNPCKQYILEVARLGVRECLLKASATTEDLVKRVRTRLAPKPSDPVAASTPGPGHPAPVEHRLSREETLRRLKSAQLPSLSAAAGELLSHVASPRASVTDIAASLKKDPALAARVLRIANSAAFVSARAKIVVIEDAIRHIGTSTVRNLAASFSVFDAIGGGNDEVIRGWQHCLAVATLMEKLAAHGNTCMPGLAYMVGLCHDLPDLMLRRYFPEQHAALQARPQKHGRPSTAAYAEVFGLSCRDLVGELLEAFDLPAAITDPIREYHAHNSADIRGGSVLARMLSLSHYCAHGMLLAGAPGQPLRPLNIRECSALLNNDVPAIDLVDIRNATILTCNLISGTSTAIAPEYPRAQRRILYLRESTTAIDPLHALLTLLADEVILWDAAARSTACSPDGIVVVGDGPETLAALQQLRFAVDPLPPVLWLGGTADQFPPAVANAVSLAELPTTAEAVHQFLTARAGCCRSALAA